MKVRTIYYDITFIFAIELMFLFVYLLGPTPNQFPFALPIGLRTYFYDNISQFFVIMFLPYLPELIFHIYNVNIAMFLGLSIIWIPSLLVLTWLIRQLFIRVASMQKFEFYYAYIPILFTLFMPHTLLGLFTYNGSHFFSTLSQIFVMFVAIISGIVFYISGERKFILIAAVSILIINIQTFSISFFLVSILLMIFSGFAINKRKAVLRSFLLIVLAVTGSAVYLYASHATVSFPYYNLSIPSIEPTDPSYRVFLLSIFSKSRGIWNVFTMQNYVNDPYFPLYYPSYIYTSILFILTIISLFPFFYFSNKFRRIGIPIYLSLISFEILNSFANPFISLVFPQNISVFYDLSYVFNNNTVFYYPLQILASLSFLISILSIADFIRFVRRHTARFPSVDVRILNHKLRKYLKPTFSIILAVIMVSPLISYDAHQGLENPVPYQNYEPFITYFNNQENASIYFDQSQVNQVLSIIESNSFFISNPQLTPEQTYPLSTAVSFFNIVHEKLQPEYMDYILNIFGYNYIVTSNLTLSSELINSALFSMALNHSGVEVLKIVKNVNQERLVLLSSSAMSLLNLVNGYGIFPTWIYSEYLLSMKSLESIFDTGTPVYIPDYKTPQDLFSYVNGTDYLIPTQYTANTYYSDRWEIGYLPQYAQETWTQNIPLLANYSYQSELNVNYGYIFTSTPNTSIKINYDLPKGDYAVLVNYLKSNIGGGFNVNISGDSKRIDTMNSSSFFLTSYIGSYNSTGEINVDLTNLKGFNTLAYLSFVPYSNYSKLLPMFCSNVISSSLNSIYSFLGIQHIYNVNISTPYDSRSLTYQQLFNINVSLPGVNANLSNILFTYTNGSPVYAFIQSISHGINAAAKIWLRMSGEVSRTLHLIVFNKNVSLMGNYLGEAPNLSISYGEYFNAPSVFGNSTSPNAWDWADSYEGWSTVNGSATYIHDGVHVNGTLNGQPTISGGIYMDSTIAAGESFTVYGWSLNSTVIQVNGYSDSNHSLGVGYGFVGGSGYYYLQEYPTFTINISVPEQRGLFYNFTLQTLYNNTVQAELNSTYFRYSADPYPSFFGGDQIMLRESINSPQYYEYAFIRTIPFSGIMPHITLLNP